MKKLLIFLFLIIFIIELKGEECEINESCDTCLDYWKSCSKTKNLKQKRMVCFIKQMRRNKIRLSNRIPIPNNKLFIQWRIQKHSKMRNFNNKKKSMSNISSYSDVELFIIWL
jgi:hypothetical protein